MHTAYHYLIIESICRFLNKLVTQNGRIIEEEKSAFLGSCESQLFVIVKQKRGKKWTNFLTTVLS